MLSRTIYERSKEHWGALRNKAQSSHMWKHQADEHNGEEPKFYMREVKYFRTALSRQVAEAVRIWKRGCAGSILNIKAGFNRWRIPRLVVEEQDTKLLEDEEIREQKELEGIDDWGSQKIANLMKIS